MTYLIKANAPKDFRGLVIGWGGRSWTHIASTYRKEFKTEEEAKQYIKKNIYAKYKPEVIAIEGGK